MVVARKQVSEVEAIPWYSAPGAMNFPVSRVRGLTGIALAV